ncbi:MAG: dihydroneopterin aldolase [Rhodospirillales bacterium]|nr:dihydroneopterin aldolase [Rhodospirillales bacterium]MBO6785582.1 dihydroneopterin aldolase [Rhodospirillales bacterium]
MSVDPREVLEPLKIADARQRIRHVFVRDLVLLALIGVHDHEQDQPQRVRVNLDLAVREGEGGLDDDLANVVCYEQLVAGVQNIFDEGHVGLVETIAERIAGMCLVDVRVRSARVRVEKLDIFDNAQSVGVEIERFNSEV